MYTEDYKIRFEELDMTGSLSVYSILKLAQHMATRNAENYGAGYYDLRRQDACWVAVRAHYEFGKSLVYGDMLKMTTWPEKERHMMYPRMYLFTDKNGEMVMKGSSQWMIYSFTQGKALTSDEVVMNMPAETRPDGFEIPSPRRVRVGDTDKTAVRRVQFSDSDANGHLNNCSYINYMMDLLPHDVVVNCKVKSLDINYNSQIRAGNDLKMRYSLSENTLSVSGDAENGNIFTAKMTF